MLARSASGDHLRRYFLGGMLKLFGCRNKIFIYSQEKGCASDRSYWRDVYWRNRSIRAEKQVHTGGETGPYGRRNRSIRAEKQVHTGGETGPYGRRNRSIRAEKQVYTGGETGLNGRRNRSIRAEKQV